MATTQNLTKASEVPLDRQSDIDEKEQVDHLEAATRSTDPRTAALQEGIEALHRLTPEEYEALHKRLVRKVSGKYPMLTFVPIRLDHFRSILVSCLFCSFFLFSITSIEMP